MDGVQWITQPSEILVDKAETTWIMLHGQCLRALSEVQACGKTGQFANVLAS